jgi:hypothetical protein
MFIMLYLELVSLDCPFFISSSVFSNIYFRHDASLGPIILISSQLIYNPETLVPSITWLCKSGCIQCINCVWNLLEKKHDGKNIFWNVYFFRLAIVLPVLLRFTDYGYPPLLSSNSYKYDHGYFLSKRYTASLE